MQTAKNQQTSATRKGKGSSAKAGATGQGAGAANKGAGTGGATDAATLLKNDHRKVEQLFAQYEQASESQQKQQLAQQICTELIVHTKIEEELFYPACREQGVEDDMLDEAQVEHDGAKLLIRELMEGKPDDQYYDAKVTVLREQIKHHVKEEEKPGTGIIAKATAQGVDMNELGLKVQARKQELMSEGGRRSAPRPVSLQQSGNTKEEYPNMASQYGRQRDDRGRFESDDDRGGNGGSRGGGRERDEYGRFESDDRGGRYSRSRDDDYDDDRGGRSSSRGGGGGRERDEYGRFESDDRGGRSSRSSYDDDDRRYGRSSYDDDNRRSTRSRDDDDDDRGRGQGRGWFGDSRGHAEAAREGWESRGGGGNRGGNRGGGGGRSRDDDDDDGGGRGRGWFGDSRGHAEAAREGWESRGGGGNRGGGNRGGGGGGRSRDDDDDDGGGRGRGWFGDSRGHAEAAREGWETRGGGGGNRGGNRGGGGRSRDDDDDRGGRGRGHGGWFGDSRGHSEAARRGAQNR